VNGAEAVRPMGDNILDIWDDMMKPFEQDEGGEDNRGKEEDNSNQTEEEVDRTISEEEDEEGIKVTIGKAEKAPSKEEVAMHMVNHIPFRSWCSHCIKGKSHGNQHRRRKEPREEAGEPIALVDYTFMHDNQAESEEKGMPIMVIEDRSTGIIRARVVIQKGSHWYSIKVLSGVIESLGHSKVVLKSDQEPGIVGIEGLS